MIGHCVHAIAENGGLIGSLFTAGFLGGATHCVGMCAPFVLAQVKDGKENAPVLRRIGGRLLIPYNLGRMTTYVFLAVLFSSVLNLAFLFLPVRALVVAPMLVLAGVMFLVSAVPDLRVLFPWVGGVMRWNVPFAFFNKFLRLVNSGNGFVTQYMRGVILGFMPCGLVISAVMASASAPDVLVSALAMGAFTLGTFPAMMGIGLVGHTIGARFPGAEKVMRQGALVLSALWLFVLAGQEIF